MVAAQQQYAVRQTTHTGFRRDNDCYNRLFAEETHYYYYYEALLIIDVVVVVLYGRERQPNLCQKVLRSMNGFVFPMGVKELHVRSTAIFVSKRTLNFDKTCN